MQLDAKVQTATPSVPEVRRVVSFATFQQALVTRIVSSLTIDKEHNEDEGEVSTNENLGVLREKFEADASNFRLKYGDANEFLAGLDS